MKQESWRPAKRIEQTYFKEIYDLLRKGLRVAGTVVRWITPQEFLEKWSWTSAQRMILGLRVEQSRTWRQAANESMRGGEVYKLLQSELSGDLGRRYRELIDENSRLIKTLPASVALRASREFARQGGLRASETAQSRLLGRLSASAALRLARTETAKANLALTQARSESVGLDWYVWETSQDQRVRPSHRKMQGVLFRFSDPPSPEQLIGLKLVGRYGPGGIFNCRCYPAPLLYFDQVAWPHRVYWGSVIRYMPFWEFKKINHGVIGAAA